MRNLYRVIKMGFIGMIRNGWLTIAAISVMFLVFISVDVSVLFGNSFSKAIKSIQEKVDFTIFFNPDVAESDIFAVRDDLLTNPLVKETHYVSKEEAYATYLKEQPEISDAVREYGNPFSASLDIKTTNPDKLETIARSIEGNDAIKKIKYSKQTVDTINRGTKILMNVGLFLVLLLVIISILVVINTVRLAIYTRRVEIEIMRLVGATNWFIQWPFILEAMYDGIIAGILATVLIFFAFDKFSTQLIDLSYLLKVPKPEFGLLAALQLGLYQTAAGALLGAFSSFISVRRHLRS